MSVARACCSCWASARSCCRAARQLITPHAGDCGREKRWGASSVYRTSPGKSAGSLRCALRSAETTRSTGGDRPPRRRGAQYRLSAQSDCRATRRPVAMVGLLATFVSALAWESQRRPSRSSRRLSSTLGPSTDRAASAASPGRALPSGRSRRVSQPRRTESTTRRSWPTACRRRSGSECSRCVCRTRVALLSSSTRRTYEPANRVAEPAGSTGREATGRHVLGAHVRSRTARARVRVLGRVQPRFTG